MLVVTALALVVAAAAFLVVGLAGGEVGQLYVSMALCAASLVVLAASARASRPRHTKASPSSSSSSSSSSSDAAAETPAVTDEPVTASPDADPEPPEAVAGAASLGAEASEPAGPSVWAPAREVDEAEPTVASEPEPEPEVVAEVEQEEPAHAVPDGFPIADYDRLAAAQILPLVPHLWSEEVPEVAERERATRARPAVLDALAAQADDLSLAFPIADYDALTVDQITRLVDLLDAEDLAIVETAERHGADRAEVRAALEAAGAGRRSELTPAGASPGS